MILKTAKKFFHASFTPKIDVKVNIAQKRLIIGSPDLPSVLLNALAMKFIMDIDSILLMTQSRMQPFEQNIWMPKKYRALADFAHLDLTTEEVVSPNTIYNVMRNSCQGRICVSGGCEWFLKWVCYVYVASIISTALLLKYSISPAILAVAPVVYPIITGVDMPCGLLVVLLLSMYGVTGLIGGTYLSCRDGSDSFKISRSWEDRRKRARDDPDSSVTNARRKRNTSLHRRSTASGYRPTLALTCA